MLQRTPHTVLVKPRPLTREPRATIDFETRSAVDIKKVGAWLYSRHHSTQILCLSYMLPGWKEPKLWHCAHPAVGIEESPAPVELFEWIEAGGLVEAHNAEFEADIWENIGVPDHGWPAVKPEQWCCSAAKAAAHSLPRSLEGACDALNLPVNKDPRGKALIRAHCQPKRRTKADREIAETLGEEFVDQWNEDPEGLKALWSYCVQDVRAEHRLSSELADLSPMERQVWRITRDMNRRGVLMDLELAEAALDLVDQARRKLNGELFELTGIKAGTQRKALVQWLADNEDLELPDTAAKTLQWYIEREKLSHRAKRILSIMKEVNRTSTKKFATILQYADADKRARELLLYCGAERTGRYSGRGIQVQNLPKGKFAKWLPKKQAIDLAVADVKTRNLAWCEMMHGDVMNLVVSCLRGSIISPPGRDLMTADYAAIEARCVLWESGATKALRVFTEGGDIYCDMASGIYGREITKATAKPINAMGATERDFGKVAVLGLGYGMGYVKFLLTLRTYNIVLTRAEVMKMMGAKKLAKYEAIVRKKLFPNPDDYTEEKKYKAAERAAKVERRKLMDEREDPKKVLHELALCKFTVDTYRKRYSQVPAMWKAQESAAIQAVRTNKKVKCGPVVWYVKGRFLRCRLPSGRELRYCDPTIVYAKTSWGEKRPSLRFMGIDQKTKRWVRQGTYGGKITENITQAIARDVLAFAKIKLDKVAEYDLLISVHDEIIAEVDSDKGDAKEFEAIMSDMPDCMAGCPIAAESQRYTRYRK